jgi:hypothetical protein
MTDAPQFQMLVNSVTRPKQVMDVMLNGEPLRAEVAIVEVELVDETGQHGSRTSRYITADEQAWAIATYIQGTYVMVQG